MNSTIARDLCDFLEQIAKDTQSAWDRHAKKKVILKETTDPELPTENSDQSELLKIVSDDMTFITDPQGDRASAEYGQFEPSLSDIAALRSHRLVQQRLNYLVPDFVPSEVLFWKRLMYKLHLQTMESIPELEPVEYDEESFRWD